MGRSRVHDDATADALLAAAERLAEAEGVEALTIRRLADEVGTTTRAVYTTFGSKEGLLAALGVRAFEVLARLVDRVPSTDDPAHDLVQAGAGAFRTFARRHSGLFRVGFDARSTPREVWALVESANNLAWSALLRRVARLEPELLGGRSVGDAAMEFHVVCEGLAVNELRGNLGAPRQAATVWSRALTALVMGWRSAQAAGST